MVEKMYHAAFEYEYSLIKLSFAKNCPLRNYVVKNR